MPPPKRNEFDETPRRTILGCPRLFLVRRDVKHDGLEGFRDRIVPAFPHQFDLRNLQHLCGKRSLQLHDLRIRLQVGGLDLWEKDGLCDEEEDQLH